MLIAASLLEDGTKWCYEFLGVHSIKRGVSAWGNRMLCRLAVRQRILLYHLSDRSTDRLQNSCIYNISKASPINLINTSCKVTVYGVNWLRFIFGGDNSLCFVMLIMRSFIQNWQKLSSSVLRNKLNILISITCQWCRAMFTFKSSFSPKILSFPVEVHF